MSAVGSIKGAAALLLQMAQAIENGDVEAPNPDHRDSLAAWAPKAREIIEALDGRFPNPRIN